MNHDQTIKTLVAKMRSQRKTFPEGATHQTVSEVAQSFDSLLKGRESYIEMLRLSQDAIKSKDERITELENPWISVGDRLPLGLNGNHITYRPSAPSEAKVTSTWYDSYHNGWSGKHKVTHWMPLPEPPKGIKEQGK